MVKQHSKRHRPIQARHAKRAQPGMPLFQKLSFILGICLGALGTYQGYITWINPNPTFFQRSKPLTTQSVTVKKVPQAQPKISKVPPPSPRFDFYNMLPSFELPTAPQEEPVKPTITPLTKKALTPIPVIKTKEPEALGVQFVVQAGPFLQLKDAELTKSRLKHLTSDVAIHGIRLNDGALGFRLSIGPLKDEFRALEIKRFLQINFAKLDIQIIKR